MERVDSFPSDEAEGSPMSFRAEEKAEAEAEQGEDEACRSIVATRTPGAVFEPGSPKRVAEIVRDYERLVAEHAKGERG